MAQDVICEVYPSARYTVPHLKYAKTGEFRPPLKGEFYLSGAVPEAYTAPNDLSISYHILKEVEEIPQPPQIKKYKWK